MNADNHTHDEPRREFELTNAEALEDAGWPTPFEDPTATLDVDPGSRPDLLARQLQTHTMRFLILVRCDWLANAGPVDHAQQALAILTRSIETLGGKLEHHWATPREYDLVLVMSLRTNQVSIAAFELALTSIPLVRSVRMTPLSALDYPDDELGEAWWNPSTESGEDQELRRTTEPVFGGAAAVELYASFQLDGE